MRMMRERGRAGISDWLEHVMPHQARAQPVFFSLQPPVAGSGVWRNRIYDGPIADYRHE